jgi:hypothetical protein
LKKPPAVRYFLLKGWSVFEKAGSIVISNLTIVEFVSNQKRLVDIERAIIITSLELINNKH